MLKILPGKGRELFRYNQHNDRHSKRQNRQGHIQHQHGNKSCRHGHERVDDLRDALTEKLAQCIYVICINRHNIPMGVGIKKPDRQGLHFCKKLDTQLFHCSLTDIDHNPVVPVSRYNGDDVHNRDSHKRLRQQRKVRRSGLHQRHDVVIHQRLHKEHSPHSRHRSNENTDYHQQKRKLVILYHVSEQTFENPQNVTFFHFFRSCFHLYQIPFHQPAWSKSPPPLICDS